MLQQEAIIERVQRVCKANESLAAAMMCGSFAQGEGEGLSDIEFKLFFEDAALENLDQKEWVSRISPVEPYFVNVYFVNEYGSGTAILDNLVRGAFHFDCASYVARIDWYPKDTDWLPALEDSLILDCTGDLARRLELIVGPPLDLDTSERVRFVRNCYLNWPLFGSNPVVWGELARALNLLGVVRDQLLYMVCMPEGSTDRWFNPAKRLEVNIFPAAYARFAAGSARLDGDRIRRAYPCAWDWGGEMVAALSGRHGPVAPVTLLEKLDRRFAEALQDPRPGTK